MRPFLCLLVVAALGGAASADDVDWSQYIEKPGTTYVAHSAPAPAAKAPAKHIAKANVAKAKAKRASRRAR
jgi:hypothetical protein